MHSWRAAALPCAPRVMALPKVTKVPPPLTPSLIQASPQPSLVLGRHQIVVGGGDGAGARQAPPPHPRALPKQRVVHHQVPGAQVAACRDGGGEPGVGAGKPRNWLCCRGYTQASTRF